MLWHQYRYPITSINLMGFGNGAHKYNRQQTINILINQWTWIKCNMIFLWKVLYINISYKKSMGPLGTRLLTWSPLGVLTLSSNSCSMQKDWCDSALQWKWSHIDCLIFLLILNHHHFVLMTIIVICFKPCVVRTLWCSDADVYPWQCFITILYESELRM